MIGRRAVIGLSLLSALVVCAFAAQSAAALKPPTSENTTAFTCVSGGGAKDFKDAHCDEKVPDGTGSFGHVAISNGTTTAVDWRNEKVTEGTTKSEPMVLTIVIGLAKGQIECTTVKNNTSKSEVHNVEPGPGKHTFTGTVGIELSNCNVKSINKCVVAEPVVFGGSIHGVDKFTGPNGEENAMGIEFVGHGEEETIASIEFKNKGAEACSLNGQTFNLKGSMIATNGPNTTSAQSNKHTGATLVFNEKAQTLKIGPNPASLTAILTTTMAGGGNPISLTTTT